MTLFYRYTIDHLQKGLMRCAYLAVFKCFGYNYAKQETVQILRRRICDLSIQHPSLDSLAGILKNGELSWNNSHIILPCEIEGLKCFFVIIPLHKKTTTYRFVFIPGTDNDFDEFLGMTEHFKKDNDGKKVNISFKNAFG